MNIKIGTILDENLVKKAKQKAAEEHTTLSRIFGKALADYLRKHTRPLSSLSAVEASFGILKVSPQLLKNVLEEDFYAVE